MVWPVSRRGERRNQAGERPQGLLEILDRVWSFRHSRSPRMVRVGRQDRGLPSVPRFGRASNAPSHSGAEDADGGRKCRPEMPGMHENLVFAFGKYGVPEFAGARSYGARSVTMAFVAAPLLHGFLNLGLPLRD
jgi:hypothetical protein